MCLPPTESNFSEHWRYWLKVVLAVLLQGVCYYYYYHYHYHYHYYYFFISIFFLRCRYTIHCFRKDCSFRRVSQSPFSILFLFGSLLVCYSQWVATAYSRDRIGQKSLSVYPNISLYKFQSSEQFDLLKCRQLQLYWVKTHFTQVPVVRYNNIVHYNEGFTFSRTDAQTTKLFMQKLIGDILIIQTFLLIETWYWAPNG